jgi:hypothetical protein
MLRSLLVMVNPIRKLLGWLLMLFLFSNRVLPVGTHHGHIDEILSDR